MVGAAYRAAREVGLDPLLVLAVISVESRFNPIAESVMGAKGLMQIIPKYHRGEAGRAAARRRCSIPRAISWSAPTSCRSTSTAPARWRPACSTTTAPRRRPRAIRAEGARRARAPGQVLRARRAHPDPRAGRGSASARLVLAAAASPRALARSRAYARRPGRDPRRDPPPDRGFPARRRARRLCAGLARRAADVRHARALPRRVRMSYRAVYRPATCVSRA